MNVYTKEFDNAVHDIFIWIFQEHIMGYHYYNTIILIIKLKTTFISNFDSKQKHLQISWFDNVPVYHLLHAEGTHILSIIFLAITNRMHHSMSVSTCSWAVFQFLNYKHHGQSYCSVILSTKKAFSHNLLFGKP